MKQGMMLIVAIAAAMSLSACSRAPKAFEFTFDGEASGAGFVMLDRLSADETRGITVYADLTPQKGLGFETKYLKRLRDDGILNLEREVGSLDPEIAIHVYEYTNAVSGHDWYHGNYQEEASRQWDAVSGNLSLVIRREATSGMVFRASATLSNVVFKTDGQRGKRRIERLTISDVLVGGSRM